MWFRRHGRTKAPNEALIAGAIVAAIALLLGSEASAQTRRSAQPSQATITPAQFAELATGVALIQVQTCSGRAIASGTGFLVGEQVVMTARHVLNVKGGCRYRVVIGNRNYRGDRIFYWHTASVKDVNQVDVATLRLDRPASTCGAESCHVFEFAHAVPRKKTTIGIIGHPLGGPTSLAQGPLLTATKLKGVPTLVVRTTSNEGASGSAMLNPQGRVVGILQQGFVENGDGFILGLNLVRWWGSSVTDDLCDAYPSGGITGCEGAASPPPPSPPTPPPPPPSANPVTVTNAFISADQPGLVPQTTFTATPNLVVYTQIDFASAVVGQHVSTTETIDPSGVRTTQCSGALGVGWTGIYCEMELGLSPAGGTWQAVITVDGKVARVLLFQVVGAQAPPPGAITIVDAYVNQSAQGTDRQTTFTRASGAQVFFHISFGSPLTTSPRLTVQFIRPDGVNFSFCDAPLTIGWQFVYCPSTAPQSTYPGVWTVTYSLDGAEKGRLAFTLL